MDINNFSKWLVRQGHTIYQTSSSYWYDAGPRVLQAFPFHWLIQPTEAELRRLMLSHNILSLRYSTPLEAPKGKVSYHVELRRPYTLDRLKAQARNGVKKGLAIFHIETISFERLASDGWKLQQDTLERQGRLASMNHDTWRRICLSAKDLEGFNVWAAVSQGELAAALVTAQIGDVTCVPYALSRTCFLREYVNNALFFHASCAILEDKAIDHIFYTVQSLDAPESVDEFKFRMSLSPVPVRQRVVLHPALALLATAPSHKLFQKLAQRYPGSNFLAKTEGMLRFNQLGRRPLSEQEWPDCMAKDKKQIIAAGVVVPRRLEKTDSMVQGTNMDVLEGRK